MKTVKLPLCSGANWTEEDGHEILPERYASIHGKSVVQEVKRLCEEKDLKCKAKIEEEERIWQKELDDEKKVEGLQEEDDVIEQTTIEKEELRWVGELAEQLGQEFTEKTKQDMNTCSGSYKVSYPGSWPQGAKCHRGQSPNCPEGCISGLAGRYDGCWATKNKYCRTWLCREKILVSQSFCGRLGVKKYV